MLSLVALSAMAMPVPDVNMVSLLPITFDEKFSSADMTPISNSFRHALKANIVALKTQPENRVSELTVAGVKSLLVKAKLGSASLPLSYNNLSAISAVGAGYVLQVRVTDFTIKMEKGVSKPTFTASATAKYLFAPVNAGPKPAADGTSVSVSVPAKSILMDKATMHKLCGTLAKQVAGELKTPLGAK